MLVATLLPPAGALRTIRMVEVPSGGVGALLTRAEGFRIRVLDDLFQGIPPADPRQNRRSWYRSAVLESFAWSLGVDQSIPRSGVLRIWGISELGDVMVHPGDGTTFPRT